MTNNKPVEIIANTSSKGGRPKQPLEKRQALSDNPHKNRISPPDLPMGTTLGLESLPVEPPIELTPHERKCWDTIALPQRNLEQRAWIFRSDCSYLIGTCVLYGKMMEVRQEVNDMQAQGISLLSEDGKANPLVPLLRSLTTAYQQSLRDLGMVPTRRQVSAVSDNDADDDDGLLNLH